MSSTVHVFVISPDTRSERRFDLHVTIEQLKVCDAPSATRLCISLNFVLQNKFELFTGIPVQNQQIQLFNSEKDEEPIASLADDKRSLGFYGVRDWQVLRVCYMTISSATCLSTRQVIDTNPATSFTGQLGDTSQVDKFELSEEAYAQRQGALSRSAAMPWQLV